MRGVKDSMIECIEDDLYYEKVKEWNESDRGNKQEFLEYLEVV